MSQPGPRRPRLLLIGAVLLVVLDLGLLAARMAGDVFSERTLLMARLFSGAVSLALLVAVVLLVRRLHQLLDAAEQAARRNQAVLDALPLGVVLYGADDRVVAVSDDFRQLYAPIADRIRPGASFEDLLRAAVERDLIPEAVGCADAWIAQRLAAHASGSTRLLRRRPDGSWRRIVEQVLPDGGRLAHSIDVTDLVVREQALEAARIEAEEARQRLADAVEALPAGFELYDADDRLLLFNRTSLELYPQIADLVDRRLTFEQLVRAHFERGGMPQIRGADELERWLAERQQLRLHPGEPHVQQLGERWVRVHERRTRDGGLVAIRLDITELVRRDHALSQLNERLAQLNDELSTMSYTDALTGLANRRRFDDKLADETARALRHGLPLALLVVDVDHFKRYNDCHGHPAGDACLQRIAALLRGCAGRGSDVVARIGGEEFALLLPHQTAADGRAVASRVHSRLAAAQIEHGDSPVGPHVTVSIGLADLDGAGRIDAATLLAAADAALYRAKQRGRNRSEIFGDA